MFRFAQVFTAVVLVAFVSAAPVSAGPILPILSGDGETWIGNTPIGGGSGTTVIVDAHPAWQAPGLAQWVSYGDTGYGGATLAPPSGTTSIMTVYETFSAGAGSVLTMKIWADDTARVSLDGVEFLSPNFSQSTCANGSIGCEPHEFGALSFTLLTGGPHTIAMEIFQVGAGLTTTANPFAVLYEGTVDLAEDRVAVPEPMTMALLGLGAAAVAFRRRRSTQTIR
jgi:hypothetical protein